VDIAYVDQGKFWPIEVKWTNQIRSKDIKQIQKYKNAKIYTKQFGVDSIFGIPAQHVAQALLDF